MVTHEGDVFQIDRTCALCNCCNCCSFFRFLRLILLSVLLASSVVGVVMIPIARGLTHEL